MFNHQKIKEHANTFWLVYNMEYFREKMEQKAGKEGEGGVKIFAVKHSGVNSGSTSYSVPVYTADREKHSED